MRRTNWPPERPSLVLPFQPTRPDNAARVAAFRAEYGLSDQVRLFGGFSGELENSGERVTLQRPGVPSEAEPDFLPRLTEDELWYDDAPPWPETADGQGDSLQRAYRTGLGSDPASWKADSPTPGRVEFIADTCRRLQRRWRAG